MAKETPEKMYALATILALLALAAIILRVYARRMKKGKLCWDDYLIMGAFAFALATAICMVVGASIGDLGRHTHVKQGKHHLVPVFTHRTEVFLQIEYATFITSTLALGLTKMSVLLFYKRIFRSTMFDVAVWTNIVLVFVWTVAFSFSNIFQCWPIETNWLGWGNVRGKCIHVNQMFLAQAYSDVFTDVLILSLPVPIIWALQLPPSQRIGIITIFLLGALTVCTGVAKLIVFYDIVNAASQESSVDVTYISTPVIYWAMVESSLGIVGACLPLMRPLVAGDSPRNFLRSLHSIVFTRSQQSKGSATADTAPPDPRYASWAKVEEAEGRMMSSSMAPAQRDRFYSDDRTLADTVFVPSPVSAHHRDRVPSLSPKVMKGSPQSLEWKDEHLSVEKDFRLSLHGLPITPIGDVEQHLQRSARWD